MAAALERQRLNVFDFVSARSTQTIITLLILVDFFLVAFISSSYVQNPGRAIVFGFEIAIVSIIAVELLVRIWATGTRAYFLGPGRLWNVLDCLLVAAAVSATVIAVVFGQISGTDGDVNNRGAALYLAPFLALRLLRASLVATVAIRPRPALPPPRAPSAVLSPPTLPVVPAATLADVQATLRAESMASYASFHERLRAAERQVGELPSPTQSARTASELARWRWRRAALPVMWRARAARPAVVDADAVHIAEGETELPTTDAEEQALEEAEVGRPDVPDDAVEARMSAALRPTSADRSVGSVLAHRLPQPTAARSLGAASSDIMTSPSSLHAQPLPTSWRHTMPHVPSFRGEQLHAIQEVSGTSASPTTLPSPSLSATGSRIERGITGISNATDASVMRPGTSIRRRHSDVQRAGSITARATSTTDFADAAVLAEFGIVHEPTTTADLVADVLSQIHELHFGPNEPALVLPRAAPMAPAQPTTQGGIEAQLARPSGEDASP